MIDVSDMFSEDLTLVGLLELINPDWEFEVYDRSGDLLLDGNVGSYMNGEYDDYEETEYDDVDELDTIITEVDDAVVEGIKLESGFISLTVAL